MCGTTRNTHVGKRLKMGKGRTLFEKIWTDHVAARLPDDSVLLSIDRHLINEVTSPQAFEGLRLTGRKVRHPECTIAVADHNIPTERRVEGIAGICDVASLLQVETLERNVAEFSVPYIPLCDIDQGIVHVVGPELGLTLPGTTIVCGDSHTSTHGAFGALAFGIGTSEVEHVLATQTLVQRMAKTMLVRIHGKLASHATAKDLILAIIGQIGTAGASGYVIEYMGEAITSLEMAGRMTVCNMSVEAGARAGMIAPDDAVYNWLKGRRFAPSGNNFEAGVAYWRSLASDSTATFDKVVDVDATRVGQMVTWGTTPETSISIFDRTPNLATIPHSRRTQYADMLNYMGLNAGQKIRGTSIDVAFIGSCTNGRLEDLRAAAQVARGRKVAKGVKALVVPGSGTVKRAAETEGLDEIFRSAGFEWRDAGCSMCLGMNEDRLQPGQRCASTSNRNFEGRQGPGGRTHLMSPAMVVAAAVNGSLSSLDDL